MNDLLVDIKDVLDKQSLTNQDCTMLNAQKNYQHLLASGLIKPPEYNASSGKTNTTSVQSFAIR
ncbi:MAG: hypothetical protein LBV35_02190 [Acinetobacter sp.]|jgi:hypothetical protein|uniref:hypothetical protein n=1 Tax=Acinetobacter sp. TaxID=472 RepID=UPI002849A33B|nr:hypothetical protein [Acinetobacter sp.]MDR3027249.1 hypothetical protein [Acinetobacter sp.]